MRLRRTSRVENDRCDETFTTDEMESLSPEMQALMAQLRAYGRSVPRDPAFIARLRVELMAAHRQRSGHQPRRVHRGPYARTTAGKPRLRLRLVSLATALLLALSAVAGYLHLAGPPTVSAQTILRRAAAAMTHPGTAPGQVIHQVSTVDTVLKLNVDPLDTTVDQWTQLDAAGAIVQRVAAIHSITGTLVARFLDKDGTEQIYDAAGNTIYTDRLPEGATPWTRDPSGMAYARQMLLAAQQNKGQDVRLLPQQTLDGVTVDVVAIDTLVPSHVTAVSGFTPQHLTTTLYIDAQSYAIRGMDLNEVTPTSSSPVLTMRVGTYETVPLSSVAAGTFALNAPANAQVWHPAPPRVVQAHKLFSSLAQAVAAPDQPALLLSGDVAGLRFHGVGAMDASANGQRYTSTGYGYGPPVQIPDESGGPVAADGIGSPSPTARSFSISIDHAAALDADGRVPGEFTSRGAVPMTVTVAGQTVQAMYWALEAQAPALHELSYRQGTSWVLISSQGLSKDEFFAAVGALVDARTHPDVVAQAQHELDVWNAEVQATLVATEGLCAACGP